MSEAYAQPNEGPVMVGQYWLAALFTQRRKQTKHICCYTFMVSISQMVFFFIFSNTAVFSSHIPTHSSFMPDAFLFIDDSSSSFGAFCLPHITTCPVNITLFVCVATQSQAPCSRITPLFIALSSDMLTSSIGFACVYMNGTHLV